MAYEVYLVGGAVRDELLGLPVTERDWVVVHATPKILEQEGYVSVGKDFPVFLHPKTKEEYALARKERKTGPGYKGFSVDASQSVSLEEDLMRRDLTINAIARTQDGILIDPYHGQDDLKAKLLRHVSDAFVEDPVRLLRVARFYARFQSLGFKIAPPTMKLLKEMVARGEVHHLVPERVWQEILKSLMTPSPLAFWRVLEDTGALKVLFPNISKPLPAKKSFWSWIFPAKNTWDPLLMSVDDPLLRWGVLMCLWGAADGFKSLPLPTRFVEVASKSHQALEWIRSPRSWTAESVYETLKSFNAYRQGELFDSCMNVLKVFEPEPSSFIRQVRDKTLSVDSRHPALQWLDGLALAQGIEKLRLEVIESSLENLRQKSNW